MNLAEFPNVCRTCLSKNIDAKSLFTPEFIQGLETTLCEMLMDCASLVLVKEDGLPEKICLRCVEELRRSFSFKKMCQQSDTSLRNAWANEEVHKKEEESRVLEDGVVVCDYEDSLSEKSNDENCAKNEPLKTGLEIHGTLRKRKKTYICEKCNTECFGLGSYWRHMANIHGTIFKCGKCNKEFKSQLILKQHKISHHPENITTKTPRNKTGIRKKRNLPRTCDICNKTFRFHSNLERHRLIHTGEKPYLCNVCGKGFGQMSYLKIHSFIHTGEKPYKCQMCEKSFAAPGTLMTHVRIHTGERPHVCKICGKDFPQSGYLSAHIRTHTGEKPAECHVCHRRFNQSGRLVVHMRIHSGEKPYSCKECGRSFAVKGTLKKHIRTHTGERPYVCSVCGQAFAQSGTLATHMKVHRPKPLPIENL